MATDSVGDNARTLKALILAPTRELALQVCEHLRAICPPASLPGEDGVRPPPIVSVAAIVGGMSSQKQRRVLDQGVDILIGTPGRLWDIIQEVSQSIEQCTLSVVSGCR